MEKKRWKGVVVTYHHIVIAYVVIGPVEIPIIQSIILLFYVFIE